MPGSSAEFDEYVSSSYSRHLRRAYLLTGDLHAAEDLVQVTLAKLALVWRRVARERGLDGYVRRTMTNAHISSRRRSWWRELPMELRPDEVVAADDTGQVDDRDMLRRGLRVLPARQRAVVVLRYYEDLSEADTAEALDCSVGTVKSLASRGLRRLRAVLAPDGQGRLIVPAGEKGKTS